MVWAVSVSLAATWEIAFAFSSSGYLDVSVPQVCLHIPYVFRYGYHPITDGGFPHSEILGSKLTYSSPRRFAVRRVLLRLLVPRHPPCALSNLTKLLQITQRTSSSAAWSSVMSRTGVRSILSATCFLELLGSLCNYILAADLLRISSSASRFSVMSRSKLRSILSTTRFLELLEALCQKRSILKKSFKTFS